MKISMKRFSYEEKKRIKDKLLDTTRVPLIYIYSYFVIFIQYDVDTTPIANHTHAHPLEIDVWVEVHTINEGNLAANCCQQ